MVALRLTTLRVVASRAVVATVSELFAEFVTDVPAAGVVTRDTDARDTVFAVARDVAVVVVSELFDGITRDIAKAPPSAKTNGTATAIRKKHRGNLLIYFF